MRLTFFFVYSWSYWCRKYEAMKIICWCSLLGSHLAFGIMWFNFVQRCSERARSNNLVFFIIKRRSSLLAFIPRQYIDFSLAILDFKTSNKQNYTGPFWKVRTKWYGVLILKFASYLRLSFFNLSSFTHYTSCWLLFLVNNPINIRFEA